MKTILLVKAWFAAGGITKYGGFLGILAPIGEPIAIGFVGKTFGKGLHVKCCIQVFGSSFSGEKKISINLASKT